MMRRFGLRADQWEQIKDLLPGREGSVGVTAADNRLFVDAVLHRNLTGTPWRDLPEWFGDGTKVHLRFSRWAKSGVWERVFQHLAADADNEYAMIDSTIVRAPPHRTLVRRRSQDRPEEQDHTALGQTRYPPYCAARSAHRIDVYIIFGAIALPRARRRVLSCHPAILPSCHPAILPSCHIEAMQLHPAEISVRVAPGYHAVLLVDRAGWHMSNRVIVPDNITLVPLPPKCPELNPVENIWQFLRDNWLSNRVFSCYDNIVDHCCWAWNQLTDQPWHIMTIGLRDWAHGF